MDTLKYIVEKFNLDISRVGNAHVDIPGQMRDMLPGLFKELGFTNGAEVGVFKGDFAEKLCQGNPDLTLNCIDPWECIDGYDDYSSESLARAYNDTIDKLAKYDCNIIKKTSMDAVKDFEDESLDFVYLDGAHDFKNVAMDLCEWIKKIRVGGILSGHDYRRYVMTRGEIEKKHVVEALSGFTVAYHMGPWFVLGLREDPRTLRDKERSWIIVKTFSI